MGGEFLDLFASLKLSKNSMKNATKNQCAKNLTNVLSPKFLPNKQKSTFMNNFSIPKMLTKLESRSNSPEVILDLDFPILKIIFSRATFSPENLRASSDVGSRSDLALMLKM